MMQWRGSVPLIFFMRPLVSFMAVQVLVVFNQPYAQFPVPRCTDADTQCVDACTIVKYAPAFDRVRSA